jgi:hypothetical protein
MTRDIKPQAGNLWDATDYSEDMCDSTRSAYPRRRRWPIVLRLVVFPMLLDWLLLTCDTP